MLGGHIFGALDIIHEYDINNNKWTKLIHKLPTALSGSGCTSILNGQYVILFGGCNHGNKDDIFIYCVRNGTFKESNIKCPKQGHHQAFAINDRKKDNLITFGFVRMCWRECDIDHHLFPPQYLIKIICRYYWNEWIHLFKMYQGNHYKIDVFDLF